MKKKCLFLILLAMLLTLLINSPSFAGLLGTSYESSRSYYTYGSPYSYYWNQPYGYGWNQPSYGWNQPYGYGWNQPSPSYYGYSYSTGGSSTYNLLKGFPEWFTPSAAINPYYYSRGYGSGSNSPYYPYGQGYYWDSTLGNNLYSPYPSGFNPTWAVDPSTWIF